jgi:hypothetical protein
MGLYCNDGSDENQEKGKSGKGMEVPFFRFAAPYGTTWRKDPMCENILIKLLMIAVDNNS